MKPDLSSLLPASEDAELISLARERYSLAAKADSDDRKAAELDVDFESGNQWEESAIRLRELTDQPILTWNRMHTFVQQVVNDGRENKPSVHVSPADGGNKQTAEMIQGRIRQIEYESDADIAYDTSREQQVISGRGFYRVTTEYRCGSFKQVIKIKPIHNQFSVLFDPGAQEYDCTDAEYCFVDTIMSKNAYKRKFGQDTKLSQAGFFDTECPDWVNVGPTGDHVRVAEYWVREYKPRTLCELLNGETRWKDELPEGAHVKNEREEQDWTVVQYVIDGLEVLSRTEWIGKIIPIIPVWGRQEVVRGRKRNISLIRYAHDAQRFVNLMISNLAQQIGMMPKTPYFMYEGQEEGHEEELANLNNIPRAYQLIKPVVVQGTILPLPQRTVNEPPIQAMTIGLGQAVDALKAACGIYDASLGAAPNDASGLAIQRRNQESDLGNYHFSDNEARSRKLLGRILLELIPLIDGAEDKVTIRTADGKSQHVPLRKLHKAHDGQTAYHDLEEGSYEPHISTGPSYTSQRQEAYAIFSQLAQNDRNFMQIGGDVLFRNMDVPGADELADRYKKMLPTPLQGQSDPAALQGQLSQASQMIQELSQHVHSLQGQLDSKQAETHARIQIAAMQEETKRQNLQLQATVAAANLESKANTTMLQQQIGAIQHSVDTARVQEETEFDSLLKHYSALADQQDQEQEAQQDSGEPAAQEGES